MDKYTKRVRAHPPNYSCVRTAYDTCVALPRKNRGHQRFAVLYRVAAFVAFGCRCLCQGTLHCAVFRFVRFSAIKKDNLKTQQQRPPLLRFFSLPSHVEQSIGSSPEDPTKFKSLRKLTKAPVGGTSFLAEITDGYSLGKIWFCAVYLGNFCETKKKKKTLPIYRSARS